MESPSTTAWPILWKSLGYSIAVVLLGFKISGNIINILCLQEFSSCFTSSVFSTPIFIFEPHAVSLGLKVSLFCIEQLPSFCMQGIINGKFCSFLKILIQTESKIWFYLAHWDDDIFLSYSFLSKWCFNILLWQKRENRLSENLSLSSWQIPTEKWKAHCGFLELQKNWWMWECWVTEGMCFMFRTHTTWLWIWGWEWCPY